jgi:hypothetical protein
MSSRRRAAGPAPGRWRDGAAAAALLVLLAAGAVVILHENRGTVLWFDEWQWALDRRGWDLDAFLAPHNEHLSLVPVAIYKVLFATVGIDDYVPYRLLGLAGHLACVTLLYVYVRRRLGAWPALAAAALILVLGPAWQNILWPFQIGWLISLCALLGALLLLERHDRAGDAGACALLVLALASSGLGLVIALALAVEVACDPRRRRRSAWIVAGPLALYAVWWVGYQDAPFVRHNVALAWGFAADAAAGSLSALAGLSGPPLADAGQTLGWGRALAVAAVVLLAWRLTRTRPWPPRVVALLALAAAFWLFTGLRRASISTPTESRYLYVGALFILLLAAELSRGVVLSRRAGALAAVAVVLILVANLGDLRDGGRFVRSQSASTRAALGAVETMRPRVPADQIIGGIAGFPFVIVRAGQYFALARDLGSPALAPAELPAATAPERAVADRQLASIAPPVPRPGGAARRGAAPPRVDAATGGRATPQGACVRFTAEAAAPAGTRAALDLTLPRAGAVLTALGGAAAVSVRRFAATYPEDPQARLRAGAPATLRLPAGRVPAPWHVRVAPERALVACSA